MYKSILALALIVVLFAASIGWFVITEIEQGNKYARECEPYRYQKRSELIANCIYYFETRWYFLDSDITNHNYRE